MFKFFFKKTNSKKRAPTRESLKYREIARTVVHARLEHFNKYYQLEYRKVFIKNQKSRWGSCSSKKNLNFNYRIALLPTELQDYLVVHELCHLGQMNHSEQFWNLVAEMLPNYQQLDSRLKKVRMKDLR
jgi:predicted metal-dependent hydrolase